MLRPHFTPLLFLQHPAWHQTRSCLHCVSPQLFLLMLVLSLACVLVQSIVQPLFGDGDLGVCFAGCWFSLVSTLHPLCCSTLPMLHPRLCPSKLLDHMFQPRPQLSVPVLLAFSSSLSCFVALPAWARVSAARATSNIHQVNVRGVKVVLRRRKPEPPNHCANPGGTHRLHSHQQGHLSIR